MAQLIDTSTYITLERRGQSLTALAPFVAEEPLALAAITASELLIGVYRANTRERRLRRETFVEAILSAVPILPFDLTVARIHARLHAQLASVGQIIGAHDLIIAATALAHGYALLTDNVREFRRIPGLTVHVPTW